MNLDFQAMNIDQWVEYIQTLHHREIELSLERVRKVYLRLYPAGMSCKIISLSGTNGKGSTAEICASIYRHAGCKVGKFTSPHLVNFNERININGAPVSDDDLVASFIRIETARNDIPITFFEFGTLLAIDLFEHARVDIAIMEVGLGGRLDSVNILDADVAITTSIAIDHTSWLGDTVEQIAYEKSGIARTGKPYVIGMKKVPETLRAHAEKIKADLYVVGSDFDFNDAEVDRSWSWHSASGMRYSNLPLPFDQAGVQLCNAAAALSAIEQLQTWLPVNESQIKNGVRSAQLAGRCQIVQQKPLVILDVSHNEASVKRLAEFVSGLAPLKASSKCVAVCGMLKDKEISASLSQLSNQVDHWYTATIDNERGATSLEVANHLKGITDVDVVCYDSVTLAYSAALSTLTEDDCLVVFGSFHIVGDILDSIT
jgi:dihydrofolate synthase/folylpolyglutamate synthase